MVWVKFSTTKSIQTMQKLPDAVISSGIASFLWINEVLQLSRVNKRLHSTLKVADEFFRRADEELFTKFGLGIIPEDSHIRFTGFHTIWFGRSPLPLNEYIPVRILNDTMMIRTLEVDSSFLGYMLGGNSTFKLSNSSWSGTNVYFSKEQKMTVVISTEVTIIPSFRIKILVRSDAISQDYTQK